MVTHVPPALAAGGPRKPKADVSPVSPVKDRRRKSSIEEEEAKRIARPTSSRDGSRLAGRKRVVSPLAQPVRSRARGSPVKVVGAARKNVEEKSEDRDDRAHDGFRLDEATAQVQTSTTPDSAAPESQVEHVGFQGLPESDGESTTEEGGVEDEEDEGSAEGEQDEAGAKDEHDQGGTKDEQDQGGLKGAAEEGAAEDGAEEEGPEEQSISVYESAEASIQAVLRDEVLSFLMSPWNELLANCPEDMRELIAQGGLDNYPVTEVTLPALQLMSGQDVGFASLEELWDSVMVEEAQLAGGRSPKDFVEYHDVWQWGGEGDRDGNMPDDELEREFLQSYSSPSPEPSMQGGESTSEFIRTPAGEARDHLIQYLLSAECTLFISEDGSMPFSSSDASSLLYAGGSVEETLRLCQYLDLTGSRFGTFAALITGVGQLRLHCMQERRELLFFLSSPDCPLFAPPAEESDFEESDEENDERGFVLVTREDAEKLHEIGMASGMNVMMYLGELAINDSAFESPLELLEHCTQASRDYAERLESFTQEDRDELAAWLFHPEREVLELDGPQQVDEGDESAMQPPVISGRQMNELLAAGGDFSTTTLHLRYLEAVGQSQDSMAGLIRAVEILRRQASFHQHLVADYLRSAPGRRMRIVSPSEQELEQELNEGVTLLFAYGEASTETLGLLVLFECAGRVFSSFQALAEALRITHLLSSSIERKEKANRLDRLVLADYLFSANSACQIFSRKQPRRTQMMKTDLLRIMESEQERIASLKGGHTSSLGLTPCAEASFSPSSSPPQSPPQSSIISLSPTRQPRHLSSTHSDNPFIPTPPTPPAPSAPHTLHAKRLRWRASTAPCEISVPIAAMGLTTKSLLQLQHQGGQSDSLDPGAFRKIMQVGGSLQNCVARIHHLSESGVKFDSLHSLTEALVMADLDKVTMAQEAMYSFEGPAEMLYSLAEEEVDEREGQEDTVQVREVVATSGQRPLSRAASHEPDGRQMGELGALTG